MTLLHQHFLNTGIQLMGCQRNRVIPCGHEAESVSDSGGESVYLPRYACVCLCELQYKTRNVWTEPVILMCVA